MIHAWRLKRRIYLGRWLSKDLNLRAVQVHAFVLTVCISGRTCFGRVPFNQPIRFPSKSSLFHGGGPKNCGFVRLKSVHVRFNKIKTIASTRSYRIPLVGLHACGSVRFLRLLISRPRWIVLGGGGWMQPRERETPFNAAAPPWVAWIFVRRAGKLWKRLLKNVE